MKVVAQSKGEILLLYTDSSCNPSALRFSCFPTSPRPPQLQNPFRTWRRASWKIKVDLADEMWALSLHETGFTNDRGAELLISLL